jgi:hypothetical protein
VKRFGGATATVILVASVLSVSAVGVKQLDVLHPSPVKAKAGHAVVLCPNPSGLQVFTSGARRRAALEAGATVAGASQPISRILTGHGGHGRALRLLA